MSFYAVQRGTPHTGSQRAFFIVGKGTEEKERSLGPAGHVGGAAVAVVATAAALDCLFIRNCRAAQRLVGQDF